MTTPYTETKTASGMIREFACDTDELDYVWHRDEKYRRVKVVEGQGWKFQFDNEMPQSISPGCEIFIPAEMYHRLIPGKTNLRLEIIEL